VIAFADNTNFIMNKNEYEEIMQQIIEYYMIMH